MTTPAGDHLGAIVLAGGRSARFGRDKLAELLDGRPLLDHAIDAVRAVERGIDIVVVGAPGATPALPPGVRIAHDERAFEGPLAGLAAGLRALDGDVDVAIVVGGDMPGLVPAVLQLLAETLAADPAIDLVMLADADGHARPLPAAARRAPASAAAERLLAGGERRVRALAGVLTTVVVPAGTWRALDPTGATLRDVDVPRDLPPS